MQISQLYVQTAMAFCHSPREEAVCTRGSSLPPDLQNGGAFISLLLEDLSQWSFNFQVVECRQLVGTNQDPFTLLSESTESLQWSSGNKILCKMLTQGLGISLFSKFGGCGANAVIILFLITPLDFFKMRCIRDRLDITNSEALDEGTTPIPLRCISEGSC